ncbi:DUF4233 domain-containing protein [Sinomonas sp.]|uniref:DUF4233 domain-containing protein n=1 Tax=Sinomonas sp. TaxID=1914986 RepID=UPI002BD6742C|nr:DUF4233 domain-containing protein [Sinomonas sp.]
MARLTKAQREWRPGMPRPRRSIRVQFASVMLLTEAFVAFFATLVVFGLRGRDFGPGAVLGVGLTLVAVLILACAVVKRTWGLALGWVLQLVLIALGLVEPTMYFVGAVMTLCWWFAIRTGARLDRENLQRDREQAEWERTHPEAGGTELGGSGGEAQTQ